jgi:MFS transporter, DHA1 family, inner membrane transport protein
MPLAVVALALSMFAIGTTEFVVVGLIPTLSQSLDTSVSTMGLLVTAYALGIAIGGPIITAATARMPRKRLLIGLMLLFVVGNVLCGVAPNFGVLIVARVLTSLTHAVFASAGIVVAINLVAEDRRGRAIAAMFGGLTIALVVGVPLGTFLGQHFDWRLPFFTVAVLGLVALAGIIALLPETEAPPSVPLRRQLRFLADRRLLAALATLTFAFGGSILAYTYIAPFLERVSGFSPASISWLLFAFGIAAAIGTFAAGPIADKWPAASTVTGLALLSAVLFVMTLTGESRIGAFITLIAWGGIGFGIGPILQNHAVRSAPRIPDIASSLAISAFNLGIAGGAFVGGRVEDSAGIHAVTWTGGIVTAVAVLLALYSTVHDRRTADPAGHPTPASDSDDAHPVRAGA